ncbi:hypothetical protein B4U78_015250 [Microbacterium esteraromaticum]|nr:hypothetical protein B4U78_015250 [Microbacterium esteraromaticum]
MLLYAFQLFGAIQKFTITRHLFKNVDNDRGGNYLLSPSHAHYLINPKETIFILVRTSVGGGAWQEIKRELNKYQLKTNKVHLFTFDINLSSNLFREFEQENIQVVTPKSIKNKHYADNEDVITLEELLSLCKAKKHNF